MENENCHDDWHFGTPDFASQAMPVNCQIAPKNVLKDIKNLASISSPIHDLN
jgi:hypothetical protein